MVAAVHFFATENDEALLLNRICGVGQCLLFPWQKMGVHSPVYLDWRSLAPQSAAVEHYGILNPQLGGICFVTGRPTQEQAEDAPQRFKSLAFNAINWDAFSPVVGEGIVDWDRTPALFWGRGRLVSNGALMLGDIGSQAAAMESVSHEYGLWVNRTISWVRRNGTKVAQDGRPTTIAQGFRLELLGIMNSLFALPDALAALQSGVEGRVWTS